jgi:hypothetical protein
MMIHRWIVAAATTVAVFTAMAVSGNAWPGASEPNNLTFSRPVALPGVVLPAGTYVFERASWNSPDIVRVLSVDRRQVYFMAFTLEVRRPEGLANDHVVTFGEAKAGTPLSIAVWYPIDSMTGRQFIY